MALLKEYLDQHVSVVTNDGRVLLVRGGWVGRVGERKRRRRRERVGRDEDERE